MKNTESTYNSKYKGQDIKVCSIIDPETSKKWWYSEVNNGGADDWHYLKRHALEAAKYMVDNPKEYGITLK